MTGWRVGYVVAAPDVARQIALHQEPVVSCASTVSQHAALTALRGPQDIVGVMVAAYRVAARRGHRGARRGGRAVRAAGRLVLPDGGHPRRRHGLVGVRAAAAGGGPRRGGARRRVRARRRRLRAHLARGRAGRGHGGRPPRWAASSMSSAPDEQLTVDRGVTVTMPDGIRLAADVYRPAGPGRHPVVLLRTPYDRGNAPPSGSSSTPWRSRRRATWRSSRTCAAGSARRATSTVRA